jgi:hypothetical protein
LHLPATASSPVECIRFSATCANVPACHSIAGSLALNLLHAAALDFILIRRISGSNVGLGEGDNPTRSDQLQTKWQA